MLFYYIQYIIYFQPFKKFLEILKRFRYKKDYKKTPHLIIIVFQISSNIENAFHIALERNNINIY